VGHGRIRTMPAEEHRAWLDNVLEMGERRRKGVGVAALQVGPAA